jgi:hypothetical protein
MGATIWIGHIEARECRMAENMNDGAKASLARLADTHGLRRLFELDREAFEAAVASAAALSGRTERPQQLEIEMAHVCRFPNRAREA